MPRVRAAAAADDPDGRQRPLEPPVRGGQCAGSPASSSVASSSSSWLIVEAFTRRPWMRSRQGPSSPRPRSMCSGCAQLTRKYAGPPAASTVADRLGQRGAAGQPAVGLDRERDRHGQAHVLRRRDDAERLADVGQRQGRGHVRAGLGERGDLRAVVRRGLVRVDRGTGPVAVAARADLAADARAGSRSAQRSPSARRNVDGVAVDRGQRGGVVPEAGWPSRCWPARSASRAAARRRPARRWRRTPRSSRRAGPGRAPPRAAGTRRSPAGRCRG